MGLVLGSVYFCTRQIRLWNWQRAVALTLGLVAAFWATGIDWHRKSSEPLYDVRIALNAPELVVNYDPVRSMITDVPQSTLAAMLAGEILSPDTIVYSHDMNKEGMMTQFVTPREAKVVEPWLIGCGAMASCALLLPGISGSYLLTAIGVYPMIMGALVDFIHGLANFSMDGPAGLILFNVLIGIIIGLSTFSHVVSWLLRHYHDLTIAAMTGAMVGATRVLWPFHNFTYMIQPLKPHHPPSLVLLDPLPPDFSTGQPWIALGFALTGFVVVLLLEMIAYKSTKV